MCKNPSTVNLNHVDYTIGLLVAVCSIIISTLQPFFVFIMCSYRLSSASSWIWFHSLVFRLNCRIHATVNMYISRQFDSYICFFPFFILFEKSFSPHKETSQHEHSTRMCFISSSQYKNVPPRYISFSTCEKRLNKNMMNEFLTVLEMFMCKRVCI